MFLGSTWKEWLAYFAFAALFWEVLVPLGKRALNKADWLLYEWPVQRRLERERRERDGR